MFIDSHVHLDDNRYNIDRDEVLDRAQKSGIEAFITIGCDLNTSQSAVQLANTYNNIFATIGVHPHETKEIQNGWYAELEGLSHNCKVVAYGEIGLDYHYDHSPRDIQCQRFREQIQLAKSLKLPIVIHTREAQEDTITILKEEGAASVGGVFHCFSGDKTLAKQALDLGFYLSFSGVITFKNSTILHQIIKTIPLDRIMIETDCPYLTPVPHRGKRNEPAFVTHVAETIANIVGNGRSSSLEIIAEATVKNTKNLFKIP